VTESQPRTTYAGQFTFEHAEQIAEKLEAAGIAWSSKQAGKFTRFFFAGEWGVRLFVDGARMDEVRAIVAELAQSK
jgi:hypothetical protein